MDDDIRLGISTCLLGERVRYDGGHKQDRFLTDTLGRYVTYVPVCPEYECGFGVPREAFHLEGDVDRPRLVTVRTRQDVTDRMLAWATQRVEELAGEDLDGFIFKSKSPSSGMERIKVYQANGQAVKKGVGLFARVFMERFPLLPVEEEGRLHDPDLRENFVERLFAMRRWRKTAQSRDARPALVTFHTRHKLLIMAHSPERYRRMGRLVAALKHRDLDDVREEYVALLMEALKLRATPSKNTNVLHHIMGYFKNELSPDEKKELLEVIENYRAGHVPLVVPVTLANHYVRKYDQPYLREQVYLHPHPVELRLRNHV